MTTEVKTIQPGTDFIDPNEIDNTQFQPRSHISEEGMEPLKESIALSNGNDQSVTLMIRESQLITLAGHRRVLACQELSLKVFSRIYEDMSDLEAWIKAGSSNIHQEVNTSDVIFLVVKLREMGLSQNQTMKELGLSKENTNFYDRIGRSVSDRLIYDYIDDRTLGISGAIQIAEFPKKNQVWYTKLAVSKSWNAKTMKSHATTWNLLNPSQRKELKEGKSTWEYLTQIVLVQEIMKKFEPEHKKIEAEAKEIELEYSDQFWSPLGFSNIEWDTDEDEITRISKEEINGWTKANLGCKFAPYEGDNLWDHWIFCRDQAIERAALIEKLGIGYERMDGLDDKIETYNKAHDKLEKIRKKKLSDANTKDLYAIQENQIKEMIEVVEYAALHGKHEDGLEVVKYIQSRLKSTIEFDHEMKIAAVAFELQKEFDEQVTMETVPMEDRLGNFYSNDIIPIMNYHVESREYFLAQIKVSMLHFLDTKFPKLAATNGYEGIEIEMTDQDIDEFQQLENIKEMYLFLREIVFETKMAYNKKKDAELKAAEKRIDKKDISDERKAEIKKEIKQISDEKPQPSKVTIEYEPEASAEEAKPEIEEEVRQDAEEDTEECLCDNCIKNEGPCILERIGELPTEEEKDQPDVIGEVSEEDGIIRIDEQHYIDMSTIHEDVKSLEDNLAAKHYNTLLQIVELVRTKGDLFVKTSKKFMKYGKNGKILSNPINERVHGHLRSNILELIPRIDSSRSSLLETKASTLQFILLITADTKSKKVEFSPHFVTGPESMKDFFDLFL